MAQNCKISLRGLLLGVAVFACALVPVAYRGGRGLLCSVWLLSGAAIVVWRRQRSVIAGVLVAAIAATLLLPRYPPPLPKIAICQSNLLQLKYALSDYEAENGRLPPAFLADQNGRPMHSWRVLILPFIEQADLYAEYDFTKPWNHPDNLRLERQMPNVFKCPINNRPDDLSTPYFVPVGKGGLWPDSLKPVNRASLMNADLEELVLMAESKDSQTHWMDPTPQEVSTTSDLDHLIDDAKTQECAHLVTADGALHSLSKRRTEKSPFHFRLSTSDGE